VTDSLAFGALSFSSLLTMINPLSVATAFVAITSGQDAARRRRAAIRASLVALGVLWVFALAGTSLFRFFGVTLPAFRIAGGILFFLMALPMLLGHADKDATQTGGDPAIVPLAVPLISGPGAISTVMVLMGQAAGPMQTGLLLGAAALAVGSTTVVLWVAPRLLQTVGTAGVELATRLMGLFMAVVGIPFVLDGLSAAFGAVQ
jgi:multiple antibiotic resistance protein